MYGGGGGGNDDDLYEGFNGPEPRGPPQGPPMTGMRPPGTASPIGGMRSAGAPSLISAGGSCSSAAACHGKGDRPKPGGGRVSSTSPKGRSSREMGTGVS